MCGIAGIHDDAGQAVARDDLDRMSAAMAHRGPDSTGTYVDGAVGLAMRRLSIIDLAGGDQPIANEDGTIQVVQNGEIYNYRELRDDLRRRGHAFRTESDTEVLVHLYEEHGRDFARHLRGMFGVAIWDGRAQRLVLARDPFGIKPLYYGTSGEAFTFASELKSLLTLPWFARELDMDALQAYLAFNWIPAPATILRHARKLPPGHVLTHDADGTAIERYARPGATDRDPPRRGSMAELAEELRSVLADSVRAHLVADVPVGMLLSGGVDSAMLTALAAAEVSGPLKTFSIGFDEQAYNELDRARLVAQRYGTDHHELIVRPNAVELLPKLAQVYDEPLGDSSALPTYLVSELASSNVKVALAGEGGDELFGGYHVYVAGRLAPVAGPVASRIQPLLERIPSSSRSRRFDDRVKRFARGASLPPLERHCAWQEVIPAEVRAELLGTTHGDPLAAHRARFCETEGCEPLARLQDLDVGTYLVDDLLMKSDRASMAHSLELRVPFLDQAVSRFAFSVAPHRKVLGSAKKRILRAAAEPLIPEELVKARKQGFSIPAAAWLRGELEGYAREVLSDGALARRGILDPAPARRLLDEHVARRQDHSRALWGLLMLTLWLDAVEPPAPAPATAGRTDMRP